MAEKLNVWLDDVKKPPSDQWHWLTTPEDLLSLLYQGLVKEMSLDHDLGDNVHNGSWLVNQIEADIDNNIITELPDFTVHSMNPYAAGRMLQVLTRCRGKINNGY